jgi:hypothetical protein
VESFCDYAEYQSSESKRPQRGGRGLRPFDGADPNAEAARHDPKTNRRSDRSSVHNVTLRHARQRIPCAASPELFRLFPS